MNQEPLNSYSRPPRLKPWATQLRDAADKLLRAIPIGGATDKLRVSVLCNLLFGIALCVPAIARADSLPPERQRELAREGLGAFDQAVEVVRHDATRAETLYRQAAAAFEALADSGVRNAALEYNLANTYFRLGELGRAILHYRRAQRFDPTDAALSANLEYARNRVEPYIEPSGTRQLIHRLTFWTSHTSVRTRYQLTLIASIAGWLGLALRLRWRSRALLTLSCLVVLLALANAASVAWQLHDEARRPPAVVLKGEHVLRLGRGEGYDPALNQPLGPGVELRILNQRADWVEVQLPDDQTGWLPASAIKRI
jgi:tetratricopeptide (TPR) repeat protein